jgi:16S rRNA (cytosine967-C5)-methyltransferase
LVFLITHYIICASPYSQSQVKFVNAVLRTIDREGRQALEKTSIFDNIEPWLAKEWKDTYGEEKAKLVAEASMSQSPIFISVNHPPESSDEERAEKLNFVKDQFSTFQEAELLPHGSIRVPPNHVGSVAKWPLYEEGDWWVQDASASLPAIALYKGLMTGGRRAGDIHVVDLCCAPGGKTAQLCASGFGKISAVEISSRRIKPLTDNLERLKMNNRCEVIVADGSEWVSDEAIDGVLVDAPCSATGVGSRRPDVLRRSPDIAELTDMQRRLAVHTVDNLLKPGGIMVYATCSLLKQESEDQMKWLMSRSSGAVMETVPFTPGEIPGFDEAIDENGWMRVLPGVLPGSLGSCDGFFVARLRRVE